MDSQTKRLLIYLILPLALLTAEVTVANYEARPDWRLHVNFLPSTATLIRTYQGNKVLIDGGYTDQILSQVGELLPFYDRRIDLVILTTLDNAHATGLVDILKRYQVRQLMLPSGDSKSSAVSELLDLVAQKHVEKTFLNPGQRVWLDSSTVFDISSVSPEFRAQLSFGHTHISIPDAQNQTGAVVSDGQKLDKQ